jgi:hypothetical protein
MKGAFLVSEDHELFDKARDVLVTLGAMYSAEMGAVQAKDQHGHLFTLYREAEPEWEFRVGPFTAGPGVIVPDMSLLAGYAIECNSEEYFTKIVKDVATVAGGHSWVLDGDGVLWPALDVDPARVRL